MFDRVMILITAVILVPCLVFLLWIVLVGVPRNDRAREEFVRDCHERGGVTETYSRSLGKTTRHTRFCLTKDGRIMDIYG